MKRVEKLKASSRAKKPDTLDVFADVVVQVGGPETI
jgi:hypothetical protein